MWGCEDVDQQMWRCEDVDQQMWRCEDVDQQMWGCEDVDQQMRGCEDVDLQMWGCEDVDLQMWWCEDVDQQMWGCEDVDQQMWRCEGVDQQMWRCEDLESRSADVRVWRCRSGDAKVWRCRSADVKVWRSRSADVSVWRCTTTAAFLRRTLRRRFREKTVRSQSQPPASPNMSCRKLSYSSELVIACGLPWWWLESNHWNRMDTWRFCLSSCSMTYYLSVWTMNGNSRSNLQIYSSLCQRLWSTHGLVWKYNAQNLMVYHCLSSCVLYFKFPDKS